MGRQAHSSQTTGGSDVWPQHHYPAADDLAQPLDLCLPDWQCNSTAPQTPSLAPSNSSTGQVNAASSCGRPSVCSESPIHSDLSASVTNQHGDRKGKLSVGRTLPPAHGLKQGFFNSGRAARQAASSTNLRTADQERQVTSVALKESAPSPAAAAHSHTIGTSPADRKSTPERENISQPNSGAAQGCATESPAADSHSSDTGITTVGVQSFRSPALQHEKAAAFALVQPQCAKIMLLRHDREQLARCLTALQNAVKEAPAAGLQACVDYILLPLVHLMDSIVAVRPGANKNAAMFPAASAQKVAEAAVACASTLLRRCVPEDSAACASLLPCFAAVADVERRDSSEEVRLGVLQCMHALVASQPAGAGPSTTSRPDAARDGPSLAGIGLSYDEQLWSQEPLRDPEQGPLVAFLASLLLKAAEGEAAAGTAGSAAVRCQALKALAALIVRVGPGQPWAFPLPGIAGRLGKAIMAAGPGSGSQVPKGAAGNTNAAVHAVHALVAVLLCTLGKRSFPHGFPLLKDSPAGANLQGNAGSQGVLSALRRLEQKAKGFNREVADVPDAAEQERKALMPATLAQNERLRVMSVERDAAWLATAAPRLQKLLAAVLPPLCMHPRHPVRAALAAGVVQLLQECPETLPGSRELFLEITCTLAQDEWPGVASPCRQWLSQQQVGSPDRCDSPLAGDTALALAERLLGGLGRALQQGEDQGTLHARRLTTALQAASPKQAAACFIHDPMQLAHVCEVVCTCFACDPRLAPLLLAAASGGFKSPADASPAATASARSNAGTLLPRLPMGLALITSSRTFEAVAAIPRTLGRLAALAGDTALRCLVDHLCQQLNLLAHYTSPHPQHDSYTHKRRCRRALAAPATKPGGSSLPATCRAATLVISLSQVVFGASPAWTAGTGGLPLQELSREHAGELASQVQNVEEVFVQESLWGLPTAITELPCNIEAEAHSGQQKLTPQLLGENALLARVLLEGVGVCARASGRRFASSGRLLRPVLLPLLERLGDACPSVAVAADDALACLCAHAGYAGLQGLVAANTDYIVDGLCSQLRTIESHPRAPALFAALLSRAGVPGVLLPLMAEPARSAVCGLSISSRHRQPQHMASFLRVLVQVNNAAKTEAVEVLQAMQSTAADVQHEVEQCQSDHVASEPACMLSEGLSVADGNALNEEALAASGSMQEVHSYFKDRWEAKERAAASRHVPEGNSHTQQASTDGEEGDQVRLLWDADRWQQADSLRARAHAAAVLANAAAEVSAPLVTASQLQVAVLAMDAATSALAALQVTSQVREVREGAIEPHVARQAGEVAPLPPETPQLLPQVHLVWGPLMAAIKDSRLPVVERALAALADLAEAAGGSFLARRMAQEAWPALRLLLRHGPRRAAQRHDSAFSQHRQELLGRAEGVEDAQPHAPATVDRARLAAMRAISRIAGSQKSGSSLVLLAFSAAEELTSHIGTNRSCAMRETACQALLALAELDCDAVWLVLIKLAAQHASFAASMAPPRLPPHPAPATAQCAKSQLPEGANAAADDDAYPIAALEWPSFRQLCPDAGSSNGSALAPQPLPGQVAQAQKLLALVEKLHPVWHDQLDLARL